MKTLLVGINAKFIHSNLAIRCLKKYAEAKIDTTVTTCEYTINQQPELILREILKQQPTLIGFSCYIWNFELIRLLVVEIKKLLPYVVIFLGGPEVSYDSESVMDLLPIDAVICGEGEEIFCQFLAAVQSGSDYSNIRGLTHRKNGKIIKNPPMPPINMDDVPFVYDDLQTFADLENRIVYYESSRGCPFHCQYCLSNGDGRVSFVSLERVFADMLKFLKANVRQVKFVDRTFNCDKKIAMAIWTFLSENDNQITNFHFEIAAELMDSQMLDFLHNVRKGLFQFEIGVQSTNLETLKAIRRITLPQKLTPIVKSLQQGDNIHLHLDLIAGLPYEGYTQFTKSFDYVYSLSPNQLQLGFLKLLKGSGLFAENDKYNIIHTDYAPYEVLQTDWLSYSEVLRLKMVEEMVEIYYNSNHYDKSINFMLGYFSSPFKLFESLGDFYEENNLHLAPHSKVEYYTILKDFIFTIADFANDNKKQIEFQWCIKYDCYSYEKAKKLPEWVSVSFYEKYKKFIYDFVDNKDNVLNFLPEYANFDTKQILRMAHLEVFPFGENDEETLIIFNYKSGTNTKCKIEL